MIGILVAIKRILELDAAVGALGALDAGLNIASFFSMLKEKLPKDSIDIQMIYALDESLKESCKILGWHYDDMATYMRLDVENILSSTVMTKDSLDNLLELLTGKHIDEKASTVFIDCFDKSIASKTELSNYLNLKWQRYIGESQNNIIGSVNFRSFYDSILKEFTEKNDDSSKDLVGDLSAEESYIDAYIEVKGERRLALSYLVEWFGEKEYGNLLIHGEPGHGKSTLCKKAVVEYKNHRFLNDKAANVLVVSINTGRNKDIISEKGVSYKDILAWGPVGEHKFSFEDCRGSLLFIDGFDEFVDDAARAGEQEQDIVFFMGRLGEIAKTYEIHIVVLSRTIAVQSHLQELPIRDKSFPLSPINMEQQLKWIEEHSVEVEYIERYKELQADKNMRDLLGIPLLFRMIVHTRFKKITSNVVELYDALFDHLMEKRFIRGKALESVRKGLKDLAYDIYCYDTHRCEYKDNEWNNDWILAFYVITEEGKKIGFFHRSFYQYFMAKYIYDGLFQVTDDKVEDYLAAFAERELDDTIREYLFLLNRNEKVVKAHDNMRLVINALIRREAYLITSPKYPFGKATKTRIGRSINITRNILHIAASLSYVMKKPLSEGLDTLIRTFGGNVVLERSKSISDREFQLRIYSEVDNRADLSGANLCLAGLDRVDLSLADLSGADLSRADLRKAILNGAILSRADLSRADLSRAKMRRVDLKRARLSGACLHEADLWKVDLSGADLSGADLSRARFMEAILSGADLMEVNLRRADLRKADLSRANLNGADLVGALLISADLSGADLSGADLSGANLSGANLNVKCLKNTIISWYYKKIINQHIEGYETIRWF